MSEDNIINLDEHRPHNAGTIRCLACKHEWTGVAPMGLATLECPECKCMRGVYKHHLAPIGKVVFYCLYCRGDLFYVLQDSCCCIGCGFFHDKSEMTDA